MFNKSNQKNTKETINKNTTIGSNHIFHKNRLTSKIPVTEALKIGKKDTFALSNNVRSPLWKSGIINYTNNV